MQIPDLAQIDTAVEFYDDRYQKGYMEEWDDAKKEKVRDIIRGLNLPAYGKALDFGCGNGVFTNILKQVLPSWEVYGVEISEIAIANATKKFPSCIFFSANDHLKFNNQFDFLFSHHVIEHVQHIEETFTVIDSYLKPTAYQLHILPCGNPGSFEYNICRLKKNGIEKDRGNRFFYEETGHLRRLTSDEFSKLEKDIHFELKQDFYANQYHGAINWITKSSPTFIKKLTNTADATDTKAVKELQATRKKLLPICYLQFPYAKYWLIKSKWHKKLSDYIKLAILFIPALISKPVYQHFEKKAALEWVNNKTVKNGSEMYLFFAR